MSKTEVNIELLKHVTAYASCPECGKVSGTDMGGCKIEHLKPKVTFFCGEHGEWEVPINWGDELNRLIAKK